MEPLWICPSIHYLACFVPSGVVGVCWNIFKSIIAKWHTRTWHENRSDKAWLPTRKARHTVEGIHQRCNKKTRDNGEGAAKIHCKDVSCILHRTGLYGSDQKKTIFLKKKKTHLVFWSCFPAACSKLPKLLVQYSLVRWDWNWKSWPLWETPFVAPAHHFPSPW